MITIIPAAPMAMLMIVLTMPMFNTVVSIKYNPENMNHKIFDSLPPLAANSPVAIASVPLANAKWSGGGNGKG